MNSIRFSTESIIDNTCRNFLFTALRQLTGGDESREDPALAVADCLLGVHVLLEDGRAAVPL